jgi:release factor glutamine methyltransferase
MNETELLFTEILQCDRLSLYLNRDLTLDRDNSCFVSGVLKRRIRGEPIQYILGKAEFMGLEFKVAADVFIPRPETEILVEAAIEISSRVLRHACLPGRQASCVKILDLGTGSGCIAVSLAKFLPDTKITATDISCAALNIARENAKLHGVNIDFIQGDLFDTLGGATLPPPVSPLCGIQSGRVDSISGAVSSSSVSPFCATPSRRVDAHSLTSDIYDLIISNPPYIPAAEIDTLQPEIRHEPRIALEGGEDGLEFYRRIISGSARFLKDNGYLIMEMGFSQAGCVKDIFQRLGGFQIIDVVKDYSGIDRVIVARRI